jgi:hypothetical protein
MNRCKHRAALLLQIVALLLMFSTSAQAATRAWLDRASTVEGQPVTLNLETDQPGAMPDWTPLAADFSLSGQTSSRQTRLENGTRTTSALFGVVLTPKRVGTLTIPSLRLGGERTAPLVLQVSAAPRPVAGDAVAFIETEVDDRSPYVQQSVGVVVRLHFATQLASGELVLDTPAGASLQRVGDDVSSQREVGGRRYNVVERRFLLIPERSGKLQIPAARFSGRGVGGLFDEFMGRSDGRLSASSAAITLDVRPQPGNAPQPWLPLKDLRLRYVEAPQQARVGEAFVIQIEAIAEGATRAQFPDLPVPSLGDAAQVFAEPAQFDESFRGTSPQLKIVRRYSIVPQQGGALTVPGVGLKWWDVATGQVRRSEVPALTLDVSGGTARVLPPPIVDPQTTGAGIPADTALAPTDVQASRASGWMVAAIGFALLWLLTLIWALRRRGAASQPRIAAANITADNALPDAAELRRAIDRGGLDEVAALLCRMGGVSSLDAVIDALALPEQRDALQRLQRARWAGQGDVSEARAVLRQAFNKGPQWKTPAVVEKTVLAPLYPERPR